MAVKLRLRRTGKKNKPCYRIVAADSRSPRDGRFIEILGFYDPRRADESIDLERANYWIKHGAQPSETVAAVIKRVTEGPKEKELTTLDKENEVKQDMEVVSSSEANLDEKSQEVENKTESVEIESKEAPVSAENVLQEGSSNSAEVEDQIKS